MSDLWPEDITKVTVIAPVAILKEQAAMLGEKTQHLVEAEVETIAYPSRRYQCDFGYTFDIVAPLLAYRYRLFSIYYGVSMYPVEVDLEEEMKKDVTTKLTDYKESKKTGWEKLIQADSKNEFLTILKEIFASTKTKQVIQAILAQSGAKIG